MPGRGVVPIHATDRYAGRHGTSCKAALESFDQAVLAVLAHRPESALALERCLAADPDMVAAHALGGLGTVMLARAECVAAAAGELEAARAAALRQGGMTPFETALVDALGFAVEGRTSQAVAVLDAALEHQPNALLLAKLAHNLRFMNGDLAGMVRSTGRLLRHWDAGMAGYGFLLGCHAFGLEENGERTDAERIGRRAVLLEPCDAWGLHAVAHVYEMQRRTGAGIAWLTNAWPNWQGCHNFRFHMAWHLALFLLEEERIDEVLDLYDQKVRPESTDDIRDVANAASLLWRLRQQGVPVGRRWEELAEIAHRRRRETTLVFGTLHQLLALVAAGDQAAIDELLEALATQASAGRGDQSAVAARIGLPLARLIAGRAKGMRPGALLELAEHLSDLGGSHAQRDVFLRTLILHVAAAQDAQLLQRLLNLRHQIRPIDRFAAGLLPGERYCHPPSLLR